MWRQISSIRSFLLQPLWRTPQTMEKATRAHVSKLFWARPQHAARPHAEVIHEGLPWALTANSKISSRRPCESRCQHLMAAYHVPSWGQSLRPAFIPISMLECRRKATTSTLPVRHHYMLKQGVVNRLRDAWLFIISIISELEHSQKFNIRLLFPARCCIEVVLRTSLVMPLDMLVCCSRGF